jgi:hypothetical protein
MGHRKVRQPNNNPRSYHLFHDDNEVLELDESFDVSEEDKNSINGSQEQYESKFSMPSQDIRR